MTIRDEVNAGCIEGALKGGHHAVGGIGNGVSPAIIGGISEDADGLKEADEVVMAKAGQQGLDPGRVSARVATGVDALVGQVSAARAGDEQLAAETGVDIQQGSFAPVAARLDGGDHTGRAGSDNGYGSVHRVILA
ncbi:hypothetical protein SDC9_161480 [bioreactor metagenome]|uniref:Uncharacterized protein n=1 Tax=bioreactor metagenome TaxID=1076179 RepID=A0A645FPJ0_9ZZZZ